MPFDPAVLDALSASLSRDLRVFLPEAIIAGGVVLILLLRLWPGTSQGHRGGAALAVTLVALGAALGQWRSPEFGPYDSFGGLVVADEFTVYLRLLIVGGCGLTILTTLLSGLPDADDSADFYALLLGATLGMLLMASANHLLMVYLAIEMASVPSYALAGFLKGRPRASEAALKYVVYGGSASGLMLYGISLLCGQYGTGHLPELAAKLAAHEGQPLAVLLALGMIVVGLGFKLSAVPFHFWCPDVFEGASAEVAAFLSVVSKGAALGLTGRLVLAVSGSAGAPPAIAAAVVPVLALLAALSMTVGNLAAFSQTNLQRLLAYSTIAHAGTMLVGLAALTRDGVAAVLYYLVAYLFANLGAFAAVAFVRRQTGRVDAAGLSGLVYRSPGLAIALTVFLLSLLGMPPLAGFAAKFQIFVAAVHSGDAFRASPSPWIGYTLYGLVAVGLLNTVFGAVYYLRLVRLTLMDRPAEATELTVPRGATLFAAVLAILTLVPGLAWDPVAKAGARGAAPLAVNEKAMP